MGAFALRMLKLQAGRCPLCGDFLLRADHQPQSPQEWERWAKVIRTAIVRHSLTIARGNGTSDTAIRFVHTSCRRRHPADQAGGPAFLHARKPSGLA